MRLLVGACLAIGTMSNVAAAADLGGSLKDHPYVAPVWNGFYIGGAVGYGWGSSSVSGLGTKGIPDASVDLSGQHGVVSVGYDHQLASRWIAGLFADYALGTTELGQLVSFSVSNQWAVGARIGVLAAPSTLLHASAGYTGADFKASVEGIRPIAHEAVSGYFVGIGGEQALSPNLALKLDYRFSDYEDVKSEFEGGSGTFDNNSVHSLRLGLNYRFGR